VPSKLNSGSLSDKENENKENDNTFGSLKKDPEEKKLEEVKM